MPAAINVGGLRARGLPRARLLRAPSAYVELHSAVDSAPAAKSEPSERSLTPEWPSFKPSIVLPSSTALGVVVRDASNSDKVIGRCEIPISASVVEGWFVLTPDASDVASHAIAQELYLSIEYPGYATESSPPRTKSRKRRVPELPTEANGGERRVVCEHVGRLFRCGELEVSVFARGVPTSVHHPHLALDIQDQTLKGNETSLSRTAWVTEVRRVMDEMSVVEAAAAERGAEEVQEPQMEAAGAVVPDRTRTSLGDGESGEMVPASEFSSRSASMPCDTRVESVNVQPSALKKFSTARMASKKKVVTRAAKAGIGLGQGLVHALTTQKHDASLLENGKEVSEKAAALAGKAISNASSGVLGEILSSVAALVDDEKDQLLMTTEEFKTAKLIKNRRDLDFGSFKFALLQGDFPRELSLVVSDKVVSLPISVPIADQVLNLPDSIPEFATGSANEYILQRYATTPGPENSKVFLTVRITYRTWDPIAKCNNVTPRFRELMSDIENAAPNFKTSYPDAENLTYLFVGGLFTQHYPGYFSHNIQFLQERLCLPRVQVVPIHTELSVARNAKVICDSVLKTCRGAKSVVLLGHSKGGVDVLSVIQRHPETIPFLHGIVTFQAPFSGTFLVEFVSRSKMALSALAGVIEKVWGGEQESFHDMSYAARNRVLSLVRTATGNKHREVSEGVAADAGFLEDAVYVDDDEAQQHLALFKQVPTVSFGSTAPFEVHKIRSAANAAGVASMAPAAQKIMQYTGFRCDGLVASSDARVPFCDLVALHDMMHTEPALYVPGTKYKPGHLTACALALLFEKVARENA